MITQAELVGFVELKIGSIDVRVPLRQVAEPKQDTPLAVFYVEGNEYAIFVRGKDRSDPMMAAVEEASIEAVRHLSKKLLN